MLAVSIIPNWVTVYISTKNHISTVLLFYNIFNSIKAIFIFRKDIMPGPVITWHVSINKKQCIIIRESYPYSTQSLVHSLHNLDIVSHFCIPQNSYTSIGTSIANVTVIYATYSCGMVTAVDSFKCFNHVHIMKPCFLQEHEIYLLPI